MHHFNSVFPCLLELLSCPIFCPPRTWLCVWRWSQWSQVKWQLRKKEQARTWRWIVPWWFSPGQVFGMHTQLCRPLPFGPFLCQIYMYIYIYRLYSKGEHHVLSQCDCRRAHQSSAIMACPLYCPSRRASRKAVGLHERFYCHDEGQQMALSSQPIWYQCRCNV